MKRIVFLCFAAFALSGCVVTASPGGHVVQPSYGPTYVTPPPVYHRQHYHRPVCRDVFSGRDYYGRPVYRRVCN